MYAIIEAGGKQLRVSEGDKVNVELIEAEAGSQIKLEKVLALIKDEGAVFGTPYVPGASVSAEVVGSGKGDKVLVYKQKPRKCHRKLRGHRQPFTTLVIKEIGG